MTATSNAADRLSIREVSGKWVAYTSGAVYAETSRALELTEGDLDPVIYIPREDVAMAFFDKSETRTHCPFKGDASYYSIDTKSKVIADAAWSYEDPIEAAAAIKGYLAFDPSKVTVEKH